MLPVPTHSQTAHHANYVMPQNHLLFANDFLAGRTYVFDLTDPYVRPDSVLPLEKIDRVVTTSADMFPGSMGKSSGSTAIQCGITVLPSRFQNRRTDIAAANNRHGAQMAGRLGRSGHSARYAVLLTARHYIDVTAARA